ncbi:MAG: SprT family zinc-dependent metalloprotease [Pseudomonadota bacterium]
MQSTITIDGRTVPINMRINRRAKRIILRIDRLHSSVTITVPSERRVKEALSFAETRRAWIKAQLENAARPSPFQDGTQFPLRGQKTDIVHVSKATHAIELDTDNRRLLVSGDTPHINRRVTDWLKRQARIDLTARADIHAETLGVQRGGIRIRDTKSRWGSCSSSGHLSFSWRLILAPSWILDYVAAHECAHLLHLDHSPAYWRTLKKTGVDARAAKIWFDENGADLFVWGVV